MDGTVAAAADSMGFVVVLTKMATDTELARGVTSAALMAALSAPMALLGQGLKWLPDRVVAPEAIPAVLGGVGLVAGVALGYYTPMDMDLSMAVGMGAGLGGKTAHDLQRRVTAKKGE